MISLLIGTKGSGKTKKIIECVNEALETSKGNVVVVEKAGNIRHNINYRARLVLTDDYSIKGYDALYGLLCGLCAGDHDITDIFVDATLTIASRDYEELAEFLSHVNALSEMTDTKFLLTLSTDRENIPESVFEFCEVL